MKSFDVNCFRWTAHGRTIKRTPLSHGFTRLLWHIQMYCFRHWAKDQCSSMLMLHQESMSASGWVCITDAIRWNSNVVINLNISVPVSQLQSHSVLRVTDSDWSASRRIRYSVKHCKYILSIQFCLIICDRFSSVAAFYRDMAVTVNAVDLK